MKKLLLILLCSLSFGSFLDNATAYGAFSQSTPYINGINQTKDNYVYTIGLRKIALFPYQVKSNFYKGDENALSDNALLGAVNGFEYLISASSVQNQGHSFLDQEYWLKWSNDKYIAKVKYLDKGSRDLQFASADFRSKLSLGPVIVSYGTNIMAHPTYGHDAYDSYEGYWWELAYMYGYTDYTYPVGDINDNGEIDDYYIWLETDFYTEEGYWIYYSEGINYYWEDPDSNQVATSDEEFTQYHLPSIVDRYNKDNRIKDWQAEFNVVIGIDCYFSLKNSYIHIWGNAFPKSTGLTDKAYSGTEMQYDLGGLLGMQISEKIGVFIEGTKLSYYGRSEYNVNTGLNWKF